MSGKYKHTALWHGYMKYGSKEDGFIASYEYTPCKKDAKALTEAGYRSVVSFRSAKLKSVEEIK